MNMQVAGGLQALTEKEKQTLRLIVRGHDAKSIARSLDLSIHTINERLRDARRKMAVSSSREAARLLFDAEGGPTHADPQTVRDKQIGADAAPLRGDPADAPIGGAPTASRPWLIGASVMTVLLGLLALAALPQLASAPSQAPAAAATNPEVVQAAQTFLALVDASRWDESYALFGKAFRKLNTTKVWAATSEKVRVPLGAVVSRAFLSEEELPAPPAGYEVVKFRTSFASKADAIETVSLEREGAAWRVVGIIIE